MEVLMASSAAERLIPRQLAAALLLLIGAILGHSTPAMCRYTDGKTAYDVLEDYNFPVGLLPEGVMDFEFDRTTGKFAVYFNDTCSFALDNSYHLSYKPTITGLISDGRLSRLDGVYTRLFFIWKQIVEIDRLEDTLVFYVGYLSSSFPMSYFEDSPQCGCGFNCESGLDHKRVVEQNPFA